METKKLEQLNAKKVELINILQKAHELYDSIFIDEFDYNIDLVNFEYLIETIEEDFDRCRCELMDQCE